MLARMKYQTIQKRCFEYNGFLHQFVYHLISYISSVLLFVVVSGFSVHFLKKKNRDKKRNFKIVETKRHRSTLFT